MTRSKSIYDSARMATAYAYNRPAVHQHVVQAIGEHLRITTPLRRALDVGCGAGRSTAALEPLAETVFGLEPILSMLEHRDDVAPDAHFLVADAERLPFSSDAFDLMTAAGSLDYVNLDLFLPEARRVLTPDGVLAIYDFSARRRRLGDRLGEWYSEFERRYPAPARSHLDVRALAYSESGLRLDTCETLEIAVPMTFSAYLLYVSSETRVESAISRGVPAAEVRDWCQRSLRDVFGDQPLDVWFDAYVAYVKREGSR
jgi:SAM-dependent methyltransferase